MKENLHILIIDYRHGEGKIVDEIKTSGELIDTAKWFRKQYPETYYKICVVVAC